MFTSFWILIFSLSRNAAVQLLRNDAIHLIITKKISYFYSCLISQASITLLKAPLMSNVNANTIFLFLKTFFILSVSVNAISIAKQQEIAPKYSKLKNLYFKAI